ncbi:methylthioribulose 1-phosphate dehydratase [Streptomyces sp. NPDC001941]|uniref:methylthioribulose 1-phosphate dehydratase n=1 Tax=Streptomyces sp. NPDC001941 TaxID=3154659 RepID=UPI003325F80A
MHRSTLSSGIQLAHAAKALYERGWMPGTSGNLSVRLPEPGGLALITAGGRDKGELTVQDMVEISVATGVLARPARLGASPESVLHAALYRTTTAGAVIHAHCPYATAAATLTARGRKAAEPRHLRLERFELLKGLGTGDPDRVDVPVLANHADVERVADDVEDLLDTADDPPPVLLIADHGALAWGADLARARDHLERLESLCQLALLTRGAGPALDGPATGSD